MARVYVYVYVYVYESSGLRVSVYGRRAARVNMSENGSSSDELDERWQKILEQQAKAQILEQQAKAQQERKTGQRRRASCRAGEKMPSYKLPEIVIVQDGGAGRRRLG